MTWREAIIHVLRTSGEAMHYVVIAGEIMENGLVDTYGKMPHQTVSNELTTSINTEAANSPFVRTQRGYYKLRQGYQGDEPPDNQDSPDDDGGDGIITSFGMYWNRDDVNWQPNPQLLGSQHANACPIDFCDQIGVYILYNHNRVIYVGRTTERTLGRRLYEHTRDRLKGRWNQFSWFGLKPIADTGALRDVPAQYASTPMIPVLEALLIEACEPGQNRKRGDDFNAIEYIQVVV
ncbi:HTH domain-containing protein [Candidatus Entotheonella palauensis]|uniref:HTH domain-containing protein n=1 Tax=Candidatus Entotheonella palauensis TaxID=93172 RepID=UPI0015C4A379|nr:HTH domain-containing protein [Candidatus Entotheonella palauensis]